MKLITEEIEKVKVIVEETNGKKSLFIEGIFLQANKPNRNKRLYEMRTLEREVKRYNENYLRVGGILAAHAILYVTNTYRQNMADVGNYCLNVLKQPWDLGTAQIQFYHRVYATNQPLFYQSNDRENANKWQGFTDCGLEDRNTEFSV